MADPAPPAPGTFCWNELLTNDVDAAKRFYSGLFGWSAKDQSMGPMTYTIFQSGGKDVGGLMEITPEMGPVPPHWASYVAVEDVDALANRVGELGGRIIVPPTDIPAVGRFCVIQDPAGASICMIKLAGPLT